MLYEHDRIVLIAVSRGRRWQLPKGRIERGESPAQAARREVFEETGVDGTVVQPIRRIDFRYEQRSGTVVEKSIDFFLLHYLSGDVDGFDPHEVTEARWFSWSEALERLTFDNERKVVEEGWALWKQLEAGDPPSAAPGTPDGSQAP